MAECEWAILCDHTFKDEHGKICLIGIFDRISATSVPTTHHQLAVVMKFVGDPKERIRFRVEIVRPTGGLVGAFSGEGHLSDTGVVEINVNINNLSLPDWGNYSFNVHVGKSAPKPITFSVVESRKLSKPAEETELGD